MNSLIKFHHQSGEYFLCIPAFYKISKTIFFKNDQELKEKYDVFISEVNYFVLREIFCEKLTIENLKYFGSSFSVNESNQVFMYNGFTSFCTSLSYASSEKSNLDVCLGLGYFDFFNYNSLALQPSGVITNAAFYNQLEQPLIIYDKNFLDDNTSYPVIYADSNIRHNIFNDTQYISILYSVNRKFSKHLETFKSKKIFNFKFSSKNVFIFNGKSIFENLEYQVGKDFKYFLKSSYVLGSYSLSNGFNFLSIYDLDTSTYVDSPLIHIKTSHFILKKDINEKFLYNYILIYKDNRYQKVLILNEKNNFKWD